jgi:tetratricopeptide (TPR) repeat protein
MPADRNAHSETSRGGNTRKRRTWTRLAIAAVVVVAIISSAAAARTWRRAQQEESARARGLAAFDRSEWNLALRELGLLVGRGTDDVEVLLAFATARMHVPMEHGAQVATAIFAIDRAREFGADDVRCAQLRLRAYVGGGMLAEAQREAEHVLAIDERDREARRVYVHASCARGRFEDAEKVLRRAVNLEPTSLANRIALAEILVKRARAAALDRPPDRAASETILDEVTSWAREPDAPSGVGELVHAIALELAIRSRESLAKDVAGPERGAQTMEEARRKCTAHATTPRECTEECRARGDRSHALSSCDLCGRFRVCPYIACNRVCRSRWRIALRSLRRLSHGSRPRRWC